MRKTLVDRLFEQLKHNDTGVRKNAAQTLAHFAPREVTTRIQQALLAEPDIKVGKWLALALAKIGDPYAKRAVSDTLNRFSTGDDRDWLLLAEAILSKKQTQSEIKDLLKSKSVDGLKQAAQLLWIGKERTAKDMKSLLRLAEHENSSLRRWAILAAGKSRLKEVNGVVHGLEDEDYLVREWTECALSFNGQITPAGILIPGLSDHHPRVREWAVKSLAATKRTEVPDVLLGYLPTEDDPDCREAVYRSLAVLPNRGDLDDVLWSAIDNENSSPLLLALIDLVVSNSKTRANEDLLKKIDLKCKEVDDTLLTPYLLDRLLKTSSREEKNAIKVLQKSSTNQYILNQIMKKKSSDVYSKPSEYTVGVIIALKEEFRVFADIVRDINPLGNGFYKFKVDWPGAKLKGICKLVGAKGAPRAMAATKELVDQFSPDIVVNIGIAASIDGDLSLCDVVIATQVTDYLHDSKAYEENGKWDFQLSGDDYPIAYSLLTKALNFEFEYSQLFQAWKVQTEAFKYETMPDSMVEDLVKKGAMQNVPRVTEAKIASGPTVGASTEFIKWLKKKGDRSWKALEMESSGVTAATTLTDNPTACLVIRGISDFGDERKNELEEQTGGKTRIISMANATYFLLYLLSTFNATNNNGK